MLVATAVLSFALSFAVASLLITVFRHAVLDQPNARSLHERPVPRTGGLAVLSGVVVSLGLGAADVWPCIAAALLLATLSFADDLKGVPTWVRLGVHVLVAGTLLWYRLTPIYYVYLALLTLALAWVTNLYNFMDGSDGLAAGMSVVGFATYAAAAWLAADLPTATLCTATATAAAALLVFNFHPAKIFLGDVGSIPLGFLAGAVGILGWRNDAWPLWFPVLVFAPFIADASVTLGKRMLRGERVWQAHRDHYYQRFVRMGFGHARAALVGYALMSFCAAAALYGRTQPPAQQGLALVVAALVLGLPAVWIDIRWAQHSRARQVST